MGYNGYNGYIGYMGHKLFRILGSGVVLNRETLCPQPQPLPKLSTFTLHGHGKQPYKPTQAGHATAISSQSHTPNIQICYSQCIYMNICAYVCIPIYTYSCSHGDHCIVGNGVLNTEGR